ncbi:unnamed protein product [Calypogeia fissa]
MDSQQSTHHNPLASASVDFKPSSHSPAVMAHKEHKERKAELPVSVVDKLPLSVKELMAGGIAGALAKTSVAPFERIKILYQTRRGNLQSLGIWQSMRQVLREEGIRSFYRGNGASVLRIVPYAGLQFMGYEQFRRWMIECYPPAANSPTVDLIAGSLAGGTAVLLTYPLDLARTRLAYHVASQSSGKVKLSQPLAFPPAGYRGIADVLTRVYRDNGTRGLYRGVGATLCGILPYAGLKFYIYEKLKWYISRDGEASVPGKLACGAVAGLIGQTFTYPLDVVRRQMQVQDATKSVVPQRSVPENLLRGQKAPFKGTVDGLLRIVQAQGWRQLFAGLSLNYLKLAPSVAIGFTVYDGMKAFLKVPPRQKHV